MLPLGDLLTALISDAVRGHAIADRNTGEIANLYKEDEFLKYFSAPKFQISNIDLDLNMAIAGYKEVPKINEEMVNKFRRDATAHFDDFIPKSAEIRALGAKVKMREEQLRVKIGDFVRSGLSEHLKSVPLQNIFIDDTNNALAADFSQKMSDGIIENLKPAREVPNLNLSSDRDAVSVKLREEWLNFTKDWWVRYKTANPMLPIDRIPLIAVEKSELINFAPENLTKAKIHMELRPYEWTSMEVVNEKNEKEIKFKLVPE